MNSPSRLVQTTVECGRPSGSRAERTAKFLPSNSRRSRRTLSLSVTIVLFLSCIASDGSLSNRRTWAEPVGPDGICLDADGCIWASSAAMTNDCARIREGGEVLERIDLDGSCFATMLGGPDQRTLFMLVADWRGPESVDDVIQARTGQVLVVDAPAAGVGWP
jgi:sugar lactone lactonase YvrE